MSRRFVVAIVVLLASGCSRQLPVAPGASGPPEVEVERAQSVDGRVQIAWRVRGGSGLAFVVQRRHAEQVWKSRATLVPDAGDLLVLDDSAVTPGEPYSYRVQLPVEGTPRYVAVVTLEVR